MSTTQLLRRDPVTTVLTWQVVGSFDALFHTGYGQLLLLKLAVLAAVLLIAQRSRGCSVTWSRASRTSTGRGTRSRGGSPCRAAPIS